MAYNFYSVVMEQSDLSTARMDSAAIRKRAL